jgi:arylsulfatase A-like enzyme
MVSALDTEIGRLLDNINLTNTYVIFIGDNGTIPELTEPHLVPPGHAKGSHFEGGIRVPFVFSGPNLENPGSRTPVLTQTSDIYATVLALAGAEINTKGHPVMATEHVNIDGRSLLPVVQNGEKTVYGRQYVMRNSTIYPWMNPAFPPKRGSVEWKEGETIRDERYKLHRMTLMNQKNGFTCLKDPQPSKNNPVPCDITERAKAYTLYDLNSDPLEKNDLLVDGEGGLNDRQTAAYHRLKQALVELMN